MIGDLLDLVLVQQALSFAFNFSVLVVADVAVQVSHAALLLLLLLQLLLVHVLRVVKAVLLAQFDQLLLHGRAREIHAVEDAIVRFMVFEAQLGQLAPQ